MGFLATAYKLAHFIKMRKILSFENTAGITMGNQVTLSINHIRRSFVTNLYAAHDVPHKFQVQLS